MNKKIISVYALICLILFCICACSPPEAAQKEDKLKIVTTIFPQYDFARQIGKDKVSVQMLVTPGGESHSYEPTPQDIISVKNCDIFICTGGESDVWSNVILNSIDTDNIKVIRLMECVETVEEEKTEGMENKIETKEDDGPEYDEHVWTSLKNSKKISSEIANAIISLDNDNRVFYTENLNDYITELDDLDRRFKEAVDDSDNNMLIFGDRFPFKYLFDDYGLKYYAAFPGCSTDSDVSAKTMMFLINKLKENKLSAVYYIEFSARKIADTIASETNAEPLLFHSCHTISKNDFESGVTYLDLMKNNLVNLKKGLRSEKDD